MVHHVHQSRTAARCRVLVAHGLDPGDRDRPHRRGLGPDDIPGRPHHPCRPHGSGDRTRLVVRRRSPGQRRSGRHGPTVETCRGRHSCRGPLPGHRSGLVGGPKPPRLERRRRGPRPGRRRRDDRPPHTEGDRPVLGPRRHTPGLRRRPAHHRRRSRPRQRGHRAVPRGRRRRRRLVPRRRPTGRRGWRHDPPVGRRPQHLGRLGSRGTATW